MAMSSSMRWASASSPSAITITSSRRSMRVALDGDGRGDVLGWRRAVVVDDHAVLEHLLDGVSAAHRAGAARERGVCQQGPDPREIAVVHEFGVLRDQVLDGPVTRRRIVGG